MVAGCRITSFGSVGCRDWTVAEQRCEGLDRRRRSPSYEKLALGEATSHAGTYQAADHNHGTRGEWRSTTVWRDWQSV
jgi:hypothetical protein